MTACMIFGQLVQRLISVIFPSFIQRSDRMNDLIGGGRAAEKILHGVEAGSWIRMSPSLPYYPFMYGSNFNE